jgi:hypothetical protein
VCPCVAVGAIAITVALEQVTAHAWERCRPAVARSRIRPSGLNNVYTAKSRGLRSATASKAKAKQRF